MTGPGQHGSRPAGESAGTSWTVRPCSAEPGRLSEGPRRDGDRNELLWVDVLAGLLRRARPGADGQLRVLQTVQVPGHLSTAVWRRVRLDGLDVTGPPCAPYRGLAAWI